MTAGVGVARDHRAVERADAGAEHQVGGDAALEERPQHPDLDRTEDAAAAEHERSRHGVAPAPAVASSGCSARKRRATRRSTQKISSGIRPADEHQPR